MTKWQLSLNDYIVDRLVEIEEMVGYIPSLINIDENNLDELAEKEEDGGKMLFYLAGECDTLSEIKSVLNEKT